MRRTDIYARGLVEEQTPVPYLPYLKLWRHYLIALLELENTLRKYDMWGIKDE